MTVKHSDLNGLFIEREKRLTKWSESLYQHAVDFAAIVKDEISAPDELNLFFAEDPPHLPVQLCEPNDQSKPLENPGFEKFISNGGLSFCLLLKSDEGGELVTIGMPCIVKYERGIAKFALAWQVTDDLDWYKIGDAKNAYLTAIIKTLSYDPYQGPSNTSIGFLRI